MQACDFYYSSWLSILRISKRVEIGMSSHSRHTVESVCMCSLNRPASNVSQFTLICLCVLGPEFALFTRGAHNWKSEACANVLRQSCKQKTAGFRTYKCAVGILWATHWPVTCHSWLSASVVVGAQNYKSKQGQIAVVSLNTIPEKPAFNIKTSSQLKIFVFIPLTGICCHCDI